MPVCCNGNKIMADFNLDMCCFVTKEKKICCQAIFHKGVGLTTMPHKKLGGADILSTMMDWARAEDTRLPLSI